MILRQCVFELFLFCADPCVLCLSIAGFGLDTVARCNPPCNERGATPNGCRSILESGVGEAQYRTRLQGEGRSDQGAVSPCFGATTCMMTLLPLHSIHSASCTYQSLKPESDKPINKLHQPDSNIGSGVRCDS